MQPSEKIWHNGRFINWDDAQIHVLSHAVHYGSSCFEGIRCYRTRKGPAVFRLKAHIQRLFDSCKIYRMDLPYSSDELIAATVETVRINNLETCYIRPVALRGYDHLSVNPIGVPIETYIAVWEWSAYLGKDSIERGVDVCVSSWHRMAPNSLPAMAKAGGNYLNSQLIKMEAVRNGYAEGIGLDAGGYISEGSGENLFIVRGGIVYTPALSNSILPGITRSTVLDIARDISVEVREQSIPRELLYIADELFFTGTAAEITPICSVDRLTVGKGSRGPVTERIQAEFFAIISGDKPGRHEWLHPIR